MLKIILAIEILLLIMFIFLNVIKVNNYYQARYSTNNNIVKKIRKKKLKNIKHKIKPFDLICFRCGDLLSDIVAVVEKFVLGNGSFTHVGIVVNTDIIPIKNGIPGKLYVLESTISGRINDGVNNIETDTAMLGMQVRDLEEILKFYIEHDVYEMAWCPLIRNPLDTNDAPLAIKEFQNFYYEHKNASHDFNPFPFLRGLISNIYHNHIEHLKIMQKKNFFCSELVVAIYVKIGVIPPHINPSSVAPIDLIGYINNMFKIFHSPIYLI